MSKQLSLYKISVEDGTPNLDLLRFLERIDRIVNGLSFSEANELCDLYNEVTKLSWISVDDELPPNKGGFSDEVLTYEYASKRYVVAMFCYISNCWFGCDDTVTHWMPLPQPPKKGGEE